MSLLYHLCMNIIIHVSLLFADRDETIGTGVISLAIPGFLFPPPRNLLNYEKITDKMQESPAISLAISLRVYWV